VPSSSPRFAHELMLDSQADSQLVFANDPGTPEQSLTVLNLGGLQVDDVRWAYTGGGDLYVVDQKADQIWLISGPPRTRRAAPPGACAQRGLSAQSSSASRSMRSSRW